MSADTLLGLNTSTMQTQTLSEEDKKIISYYNRLVVENKEYIIGQIIGLYKEQQRNRINKQSLTDDNYALTVIDPEIQKELDSYRKELINENKQNRVIKKKVN